MISKQVCWPIIGALLLFTLVRCAENEVIPRDYPRVNMISAQVIQNGAILGAEIAQAGNIQVLNHGFLWGLEESLKINQSDRISLGSFSGTGAFSATINNSLIKDRIYYAKAYAITSDYTVYGDAVQFLSNGSFAPVIVSFLPEAGTWGDTVKIKGESFSVVPSNNKVYFGEHESWVLTSTDTTITCLIPDNIPQEAVAISVKVAGNTSTTNQAFVMLKPVIERFSPAEGTFGDVITLYGRNFHAIINRNVVRFGEQLVQVIEASANELKVQVPTGIDKKESVVSVEVNLMTGTATETFKLLPPLISAISSNRGYIGSRLVIHGSNFNPQHTNNKILFGRNYATIISASATELVVTIPEGIYDSRSLHIDVEVAEQHALSTQEFMLLDPWLQKEDVPHGAFGRYWSVGYMIQGMGYVGTGLGNSDFGADKDFWRFDLKANKWERIADFGGGVRYGATSFVIGNYAYVGGGLKDTGMSEYRNDFWRYDPVTNNWSEIAEIGTPMLRAVGLSANGKGYVISEVGSVHEYDPLINSWSYFASIDMGLNPQGRVNAGFIIDNRMYLLASPSTTAPHQLFELNLATRQWTRRADLSDYFSKWHNSAIAMNGKGYIKTSYGFYEYDPALDEYTSITQFAGIDREGGVLLLLDDKLYYGTGSMNGSYSIADWWEFDPRYK